MKCYQTKGFTSERATNSRWETGLEIKTQKRARHYRLNLFCAQVLQERWVGTSVGGTTLNGVAVRSSSPSRGEGTSHLNEAMVYATTPEMFAQGSEARGFASLRSCVKRTLYGCDCYAYALCASGFVDLVCEADLLPYDYLALVPVLEGAGAVISDWDGRPLTLANHSKSKGRVIAAANAELHVAAWTSALRGYHLKCVKFVIYPPCADISPPSSSRARDVPAPCLQIHVHTGPCRPPHGPTTRSHRAPHLGCRSLPWRTTLYCRAGGIPLSDCSIAPRGLNAARNKLCAAAG